MDSILERRRQRKEISDLEDRRVKIFQSEQQKESRLEKSKQSFRDLWGYNKRYNINY